MRFPSKMAASGLVLGAFLAAAPVLAQGERVDANGMPTTHSTPAEQAATANLNNRVSAANAQADAQADQNNAQYRQQQQQYQGQLEQHQQAMDQNQADQQKFEDRTAAYEALRARYAAERAAYHRGVWPDRFARWTLDENDPGLTGQRVEIISGDRVGTVEGVAHAPNGHVAALLVRLDSDKVVWIDRDDVRYDRADGIVVTNLDRTDLRQMADERA